MNAHPFSYPKDFFDLQLRFAAKVVELTGMPMQQALLDYTNLYVRFTGERRFAEDHPVWQCYLEGVQRGADLYDWTYRFYLQRQDAAAPPSVVATFGCFSYAMESEQKIRMHFRHAQHDGLSPLGDACVSSRLAELRELIAHVKSTANANARIAGVSWLYNLHAYRRLFPPAYLASATVAANRFRNMPLWGQFIDYRGEIKRFAVDVFEQRLTKQEDIAQIERCFPLQPLAVEASLDVFDRFYTARASNLARIEPL
jgi:hypothetical protein